MHSHSAELRVGISGWTYAPWKGVFYPKDLPHDRELEYASRKLNSIEINGSFYALQRPERYQKWYEATPEDFVFSVKANRFITHIRRLKEINGPLSNFFASGPLVLAEKLGPVLWQFPPNFHFDSGLMEEFLSKLPRTHHEASLLARRRAPFMDGRSYVHVLPDLRKKAIRHAVEIRHPSFKDPEFVRLLRKYRVAFVFADSAGKWPYFEDLSADFVYLRLHGKGRLYVGGYDARCLREWAERLQSWMSGGQAKDAKTLVDTYPRLRSRDAYVYFDNDVKVQAPFNAMDLRRILEGPLAASRGRATAGR